MSKLIAKILYKMLFSMIGNIYIINDKIENVYYDLITRMYFAKLHKLLDTL